MDEMDAPRSPDTGHVNGTNGTAALESIGRVGRASDANDAAPTDGGSRPAQTPTFLSELAHAMQAAADRERERIAAVVAEDASAHVEKVRARATVETEELRRLAEEDVARIDEWSAAEIERVRAEAAQKTSDRRASLEDYLKQHDAIIAAEIEGVDGAVRDYGVTLEQFFTGLSDSSDPSEIVRRAEMLPSPPSLDDVRATARAEAVARYATPTTTGDVAAESGSEVSETTEATGVTAGPTDVTTGPTVTRSEAEGDLVTTAVATDDATTSPADTDSDEAVGVESAVPTDRPEASTGDSESAAGEAASTAVGVMDRSTGAVSGWPADDRLAIGSTVDHTSAAVRLLRSVAPWTAPVHADDQPKTTDQD